jgi:hypothetical protein
MKFLHNLNPKIKSAMIFCGIAYPIIYILSDILASISWVGYSFISQSVSELRAINAPTRPFLVPVLFIATITLVLYAAGILSIGAKKKTITAIGIALLVLGLMDLFIAPFFPMNLRGTEFTFTDAMHIVLTVATVLSIFTVVTLECFTGPKWFRIYSLITLLMLVVFAVWSFMDAPKIAQNLPTPWVGLRERANIYGYMIWLAVATIPFGNELRANK